MPSTTPLRTARRLDAVKRSYIREILKVTADPEIISFAGGLPSPDHFPVQAMDRAARAVFAEEGAQALQYAVTEGFPPLRRAIAARYRTRFGWEVNPENVLVTTGSQQALDLLGKVMLDEGDGLLLERPGYLGAIQSFSMFAPRFATVGLGDTGPDTAEMAGRLAERPKLFYCVPNFQNPSGATYSAEARQAVRDLLAGSDTLLVEDDPYGELRFLGEDLPPVAQGVENAVLCGSFSKILAPGLRLGWVVAPDDLYAKLVTAKQAADLHTPSLTQRIASRFLAEEDLDAHVETLRGVYGHRRQVMVEAIGREFPEALEYTEPEGGMFLWCRLPDGLRSEDVFHEAIREKVAFVPGSPFYLDGSDGAFRLNFSNAAPERIEEGIARLGACLRKVV
ncbi:PLP-dependent aminotransferase family protein [Desulfohalovibrio reitneri]|uniref:aminotransferase-like domain-containing protein n=1 Tax=Desulfohalovibrio reitneri TaxID=1307759 RepID=UPI0004A72A46|nr:PLP-dependent aminotransferase family protein [Desulfohalovibrio reitneri]